MEFENKITACVKPFQSADNKKSLRVLAFTILALLGSVILSVFGYLIHPVLSLILWIPVFISFCRLFVYEHDLGHSSLFSGKYKNILFGHITGFLIMIPFGLWKYIHNRHHCTAGNLNLRSENPEIWTMTKTEYDNSPIIKKLVYNIVRSFLFHILFMPAILFIISKIPLPKMKMKDITSLLITDGIYGIIFYFLIINDLISMALLVYLIPLYFFSIFAIMIFYLQHQFENTYWKPEPEWNHIDAAIKGSSFLKFGPIFRWVTGNVGYHHVHHLNPGIPFYNLPEASVELDRVIKVKPIKFREFLYFFKCQIWDENLQMLTTINSK